MFYKDLFFEEDLNTVLILKYVTQASFSATQRPRPLHSHPWSCSRGNRDLEKVIPHRRARGTLCCLCPSPGAGH